ncbi:hypothetical protein [Bacillus marinisedimentorum]|nr:hypothetical protein [Bacillus marinisedimentorum]
MKFLVHEGDRQFFDNSKLDFVRSFMGGGRFDIIHGEQKRFTSESNC